MRTTGAVLLVVGLLLGVVALNMDTSVATEAQSVGGITIPSVRVNNLGLMDERRNYLIVASVIAVVGVLLVAAGAIQASSSAVVGHASDQAAPDGSAESAGERRQCPQCAELIKREAKICRFCGYDMSEVLAAEKAEWTAFLTDQVRQQSDAVREHGDEVPAGQVFELGRRWALLFDQTGDPDHRSKALAAMRRAREIDPKCGEDEDFFAERRVEPYGSLVNDPEFKEFI